MDPKPFLSFIKTERRLIAVCSGQHHYSIIDGSVNDSSSMGEFRIPVTMTISNVPRLPKADSASFTEPIMLSYVLDDKEIKKALGITGKVEIDGDGSNYEINKLDGTPLYSLYVLSYDEISEND